MASKNKGENIILEYGYSLIQNMGQQVNAQEMHCLCSVVSSYIKGEISYQEAKARYQEICSVSTPLQNIRDIIESEKNPIKDSKTTNNDEKRALHWTKAEDNRLLGGIFRFGLNDWSNIIDFVGNGRTRPQCLQRWTRTLNPKLNKEGWTKEEEQRLISLVNSLGENSWTKVSKLLETRSDVQCRYHFEQMKKSMSSITISPNKPVVPTAIETYVQDRKFIFPSRNSQRMDIDDFLKLFNQPRSENPI